LLVLAALVADVALADLDQVRGEWHVERVHRLRIAVVARLDDL
jgi:hypothetical protein